MEAILLSRVRACVKGGMKDYRVDDGDHDGAAQSLVGGHGAQQIRLYLSV